MRQLATLGRFYKLINLRKKLKVLEIINTIRLNKQYKLVQKASGVIIKVSQTILVTFCVGNTFINVVGYPACVNGKSMQPVFNFNQDFKQDSSLFSTWGSSSLGLDLDWVFVNCWAARNFRFLRGDIVVFVSPKDPSDYVIKRVIAQEGDVLNSYRYEKPYVLIPEGHCWVEGDNWDNSVDSNRYGPIPKGLVFGVATHVIWPPHKWQRLTPSIPPSLLPERVISANQEFSSTQTSWMTNIKMLFSFLRN